jgi:hypothetical protein
MAVEGGLVHAGCVSKPKYRRTAAVLAGGFDKQRMHARGGIDMTHEPSAPSTRA